MNPATGILLVIATMAAVAWVLTGLDVLQRRGSAVPLRARLTAWHHRLFHAPDPYDPAFAEAPRVIAGSDMDRMCGSDPVLTLKYFAEMVEASLSDVHPDPRVAEMYVLPEVER